MSLKIITQCNYCKITLLFIITVVTAKDILTRQTYLGQKRITESGRSITKGKLLFGIAQFTAFVFTFIVKIASRCRNTSIQAIIQLMAQVKCIKGIALIGISHIIQIGRYAGADTCLIIQCTTYI